MTAPPYMPLWIGDYQRDTVHFTTIEHGAYLLLLMHAWCHKGTIPNDSASLRAITRLDSKTWSRKKNKLLAMFVHHGATLVHVRVATELANSLKRRVPKWNKSERGSGIHKVGESLPYGETPRVAKIVPAHNGNAAPAARKRPASEASKASEAQAALPLPMSKQKPKIPVSDELKYLVSRPPRGPRKGGRA